MSRPGPRYPDPSADGTDTTEGTDTTDTTQETAMTESPFFYDESADTAQDHLVGDTRRPVRVATVLLGVLLVAVAVATVAARLADIAIEPGVVLVAALLGAGALLVVTALTRSEGS